MADEKDKFGAINVEMGDNNSVEHVGHKITFEAPPPKPNDMVQHGAVVGQIAGAPVLRDGFYIFPKLHVDDGFNGNEEFEVQGVRLKIENFQGTGGVSMSFGGRTLSASWMNVVCRIL